MSDIRAIASRFVHHGLDAPATYGNARLMPTKVKTGLGAAIFNGRVHIISQAALATQGKKAILVTRWACGGGSINARPAAIDEVACDWCEQLQHLPEGPVVYRCYDEDDQLVYIGSSINVRQRIRGHRSATRWWSEVARVEAERCTSETAARITEANAIRTELPMRNSFNIPLTVLRGGRAA